MSDQALQSTLDTLIAERDELNVAITVLCKRLGVPVPPDGSGGGGTAGRQSGIRGMQGADPVANTSEGEYFGFVSTKAALDVLTKFGKRERPLKTKDIYDAIKKGGVDISTEDALYRSLARSHRFKKVGRGLWGLSEWYPATPRKPKVDAQGKPLPADEVADEVEDDDELGGADVA
jgi:hypothetical protein